MNQKKVLNYNGNFRKWVDEHENHVTIIKNFTGIVTIHYEAKDNIMICYIEGKGNINFKTKQNNILKK